LDVKYTDTSTLKCPDCEQDIRVGTAGSKNLDMHRGSKACRTEREKKTQARRKPKEKRNGLLHSFFRPKTAMNPSTVSVPLPIHAPEIPLAASLTENDAEPHSSPATTLGVALDAVSNDLDRDACPMAVKLLHELRAGVERILPSKSEAALSHRLSAFSVPRRDLEKT
jgi:hypothetical protein